MNLNKYMIVEEGFDTIKSFLRNFFHPKRKKELDTTIQKYTKLPAKELLAKYISVMKPILLGGSVAMKAVRFHAPSSLSYIENVKARLNYATISGIPVGYITKDNTPDGELDTAIVIPNVDYGFENGKSGLPYVPYTLDSSTMAYYVADTTEARSMIAQFQAIERDMKR